MKILIALICTSFVVAAYDHIPETSINRYRIEQGKIFDAYLASDWDWFQSAEVLQVRRNGALIQSQKLGKIFVYHIPTDGLFDGCVTSFAAKFVGFYQYTNLLAGEHKLLAYDFGTLPSVAQFTDFRVPILADKERDYQEAQKAQEASIAEAAKQQRMRSEHLARERAAQDQRVLANTQKLAASGTGYAQFDLAQRYLAGAGVETNREFAIRWLQAACTNGHTQASNALARLNADRIRTAAGPDFTFTNGPRSVSK